jgi:hypothetical protein
VGAPGGLSLPKTLYALTRLKLPASDDRLGSP